MNNNKQSTKTKTNRNNKRIPTTTRLHTTRIQHRNTHRNRQHRKHRKHNKKIPGKYHSSTQNNRTVQHITNNKIQRHNRTKHIPRNLTKEENIQKTYTQLILNTINN